MSELFSFQNIRNYVVALFIFLAIDMVWLVLVARPFYSKHLGYLMAEKVKLVPALIFYMIFVAGILFFVVYPAMSKGQWTYALFAGIFYGLITYATYDLTNLSTVKNWPILVTAVDLIWGCLVSALTSVISFFVISKWK